MSQPINYFPFRSAGTKIPDKQGIVLKHHLFTFKAEHGKKKPVPYIVNVDQYEYDVFILKFCLKKDRNCKKNSKYTILTNQNVARRIIYTCVQIGYELIKKHPAASFGFLGAPIISANKRETDLDNTTRFRVYKNFATFFFSPENFNHVFDSTKSSYLLLNKIKTNEDCEFQNKVISLFEEHFDFSSFADL